MKVLIDSLAGEAPLLHGMCCIISLTGVFLVGV